MERNEFLGNLGPEAVFALMFPCMLGCSKEDNGDLDPEDMKPVPTGVFHSTHGSRFDQTGKPLNSITTKPLKIFKVEQSGNMLGIFE